MSMVGQQVGLMKSVARRSPRPDVARPRRAVRRGRDLAAGFGPGGAGVHPVRLADQVAGHDAPDGVFLGHVGQAHGVREGGLRVKVDGQDAVAIKRRGMGEVQRDGRLAGAALEVGHGGPDRALALGAVGHQAFAVDLHLAAHLVHLIEA